jgi:hypothetical protein
MKITPVIKTDTTYTLNGSILPNKLVHGLKVENGSIVPSTIVTISDSYYNVSSNAVEPTKPDKPDN